MITKESITVIQANLKANLLKFAEENNLSLSDLKISYSDDGFKMTSQFGDKASLGDKNFKDVSDLKRHGYKFDLDESFLNKKITIKNETYTIEGMKGSTKVSVKSVKSGKMFLIPAVNVKPLLAATK